MTRSDGRVAVRDKLATGRDQLSGRFRNSMQRTLDPRELPTVATCAKVPSIIWSHDGPVNVAISPITRHMLRSQISMRGGRLATMVLDFYTRLSCQRLITGWTYSLPLTQTRMALTSG